jgi:hypothetical protein
MLARSLERLRKSRRAAMERLTGRCAAGRDDGVVRVLDLDRASAVGH